MTLSALPLWFEAPPDQLCSVQCRAQPRQDGLIYPASTFPLSFEPPADRLCSVQCRARLRQDGSIYPASILPAFTRGSRMVWKRVEVTPGNHQCAGGEHDHASGPDAGKDDCAPAVLGYGCKSGGYHAHEHGQHHARAKNSPPIPGGSIEISALLNSSRQPMAHSYRASRLQTVAGVAYA